MARACAQMPTDAERAAAKAALHAARERSRVGNEPWPTIEQEVELVLQAAEAARGAVSHRER